MTLRQGAPHPEALQRRQVWAVPGLAVRTEGFENFLNLEDSVMVGHAVGKRGAAFLLADRVAGALTKSVFINVKKVDANAETVSEDEHIDFGRSGRIVRDYLEALDQRMVAGAG